MALSAHPLVIRTSKAQHMTVAIVQLFELIWLSEAQGSCNSLPYFFDWGQGREGFHGGAYFSARGAT